jgi:crotonobetaine/carnitine-CoA ligase
MSEPTRRPAWFDPALPAREDCVLKALLDSRAARHPERRLALFEDGSRWTWAEGRAAVRAAAAGLQRLGVKKGDRVLAWLPTGQPMVLTWFAANYLGAVFVPLNTAYRGAVLEHVINAAGAAVMVTHHSLVERLVGLALPHLRQVIAIGGTPASAAPGLELRGGEALHGDAATLDDSAEVDLWDIQSIIYTSGTTGASKGVLSPYLQLWTTAMVNYGYLADGEGILVNLPMFHFGGTSPTYAALVRGGSAYFVDGFSTTKFWEQVRSGGCVTTSGLIGVMAAFLGKSEPRPDDADNPLRCITMFPVNPDTAATAARFGFDYLTGFNMTEVSSPLVTEVNTRRWGSCGRPRSGIQARLVDAHDIEVPRGAIGELIVRSDQPWSMNVGYNGLPEATATAWRNGWFHTGDLFRQDEDGEYFFVDRIKDTIRRRGENISSFEVENAVRQFPGVDEVVAVGVQSEIAEQEVLVALTTQQGASVEPRALVEFLVPRLAYFMVPRYVRVVTSIPKTETNKPRKVVFRDAGVTTDTWDREAAGIRLKKEKL